MLPSNRLQTPIVKDDYDKSESAAKASMYNAIAEWFGLQSKAMVLVFAAGFLFIIVLILTAAFCSLGIYAGWIGIDQLYP
jgi:hypothetical protein